MLDKIVFSAGVQNYYVGLKFIYFLNYQKVSVQWIKELLYNFYLYACVNLHLRNICNIVVILCNWRNHAKTSDFQTTQNSPKQ